MDLRFPLLLACFVLSGIAGLIYETAWTQQFALAFGSSEMAVVTVLAAYMAGLTLGAAVGGRLSAKIRRPILVYGVLELGIAVSAMAVPWALDLASKAHVALFANLAIPAEASSLSHTIFFVAASFLILLAPTCQMGATLPILVRHAVREDAQIGSRVGVLYAGNTLGAAGGTLATAFVLLPTLGLGRTVWVAMAVNCAVFVLASLAGRNAPVLQSGKESEEPHPGWMRGRALILPLIMVSGFVSFTYEVTWTRLLGHILGGSIYAFSTMLGTFLVALGIGSMVAARLASTPNRARAGFFAAEIGIAVSSLAAFLAVDAIAGRLQTGIADGSTPAFGAGLCALTLFPGALFVGATFPFAVRILAGEAASAGRASGRVYAWNTIGAVAGAVASGLVLLPALRFSGTMAAAISLNLLLAALTAMLFEPRWRTATLAMVVAAVGVAAVSLPVPWKILTSSPLGGDNSDAVPGFFAVGRNATVMLLGKDDEWLLASNGLPESSIQPKGSLPSRYPIARWLSLLPLAARPDLESMLVVGLGAGNTIEDIPRSVREIHVVELEEEIVRANRAASGRRGIDPLADPRVTLHINDVRASLMLANRRWDAVVSQPSHPWTVGSSQLFTREFFSLVRDHLTDRGVFVQWIGLSFVDAELVQSLTATLVDVFGHVNAYRPYPGGALVFIASPRPLDIHRTCERSLEDAGGRWAAIGIRHPDDLLVSQALDEDGAAAIAAGEPLTTDSYNLMRIRSPRAMREPDALAGINELLDRHDPILGDGHAGDRLVMVRRLIDRQELARAGRLAATIGEPVTRGVAFASIAAGSRQSRKALSDLEELIRRNPGVSAPVRAWLAVSGGSIADPPGDLGIDAEIASDPAMRAVAKGWRYRRSGRLERVRDLDGELARIPVVDPLFVSAVELRVAWRLAGDDSRLAAEALDLVERHLVMPELPGALLLRIRAALGCGAVEAASATLWELKRRCGSTGGCAELRRALDLNEEAGGVVPETTTTRIEADLDRRGGRAEETRLPPDGESSR